MSCSFPFVSSPCFASFSTHVNPSPSILTNMAFRQSRVWSEAATSICREGETPDTLGPLRQAFRLLKHRPRFDVVVTMGARSSLSYGLLCGILRQNSKQIMTEMFLDAPRPFSLLWRLKTALFRWVSRRSLGILTNSSAEVGLIARRFAMPESKLRFVPMYTTIEHPALHEKNDGSVVSIGRTLRDLDTLMAAARQIPAPVIIVAGRQDRLPAQLPANVQVRREIPLEQSLDLLRRAAVVAIPLLPSERSTGQVVLFEAMALGKPVVATRTHGTVDYIRDGENGLLVAPGDASALAEAVNQLLKDPALAARLAQAALADCRNELHLEAHARRKLEAIRNLWARPPPRSAPP